MYGTSRTRVRLGAAVLSAGLLATGLLSAARSADPDGHAHHDFFKDLKYPKGETLHQQYRKPQVTEVPLAAWGGTEVETAMAAAMKEPGGAEFKLRPRTFVSLAEEGEPGQDAAPQEQYAYCEFDILYKDDVPIAKASRAIVIVRGKPVVVRDRNLPAGELKLESTKPTVTFEAARDAALGNARALFKKIYPDVEPVLAADTRPGEAPAVEVFLDAERKQGRLAWRLSVTSTDPAHPLLRRFWVSAQGQPDVLDYEDRVFYARDRRTGIPAGDPASFALTDRTLAPRPGPEAVRPVPVTARAAQSPAVGTRGTVTGDAWRVSPYSGGTGGAPLAGLSVVVKRGAQQFTAVTDAEGRYSLPQVTGPVQVTATLSGPHCHIVNAAGPVLSVTKSGAGQVDLHFAASNEGALAQVTAFRSINTVFAFAQPYLPANPPFLMGMPTRVNINQTCNAFYSPADHTINFFRQQPNGCANTAYGDVAFHEYGHAVDDQLGGIKDGGYSEGFGDTMTLLITRQPVVGRDFLGPPAGGQHKNLRDATKAPKWPDVQNGEVHEQGWAYSGFAWQLITGLRQKYHDDDAVAFAVAKRLLMTTAVNNPVSVPDAVRLTFFVDAQLYPVPGQKSRHYDQIKAAADYQKIPHPANPAELLAGD